MKLRSLFSAAALILVGSANTTHANMISDEDFAKVDKTNLKTLVVFFSLPEPNTSTQGSKSTVDVDGNRIGNTEYIASLVTKNLNADTFRIETVKQYPINDHQQLIDEANTEKHMNARPELKTVLSNAKDYDVIFLGYQNWWGDMPMVLYSFLEQYDFSGKTIVPFITHGGSGFSSTISSIENIQKKANVVKDGFEIYRDDIDDIEETKKSLNAWLKNLGY